MLAGLGYCWHQAITGHLYVPEAWLGARLLPWGRGVVQGHDCSGYTWELYEPFSVDRDSSTNMSSKTWNSNSTYQ